MAKTGPEEIRDIIEKVVVRLEKARGGKEQDIWAAWEDAAGRRAARHSQPVSLRKGILTVAVDGSAWLYQLTMDKKNIFERLGKHARQGVIDIKFRIR